MSDTNTARKFDIKSKIVPKDVGNPKLIATMKEGETRLKLGTLMGIANQVITRSNPDGSVYSGLGGTFEALPADVSLNGTRSGVCYLPAGIFELVADAVAGEDGSERNPTRFAFNVYAITASNPAGYSWAFEPLIQPAKDDPLAALRAEAVGPVLAITEEKSKAKKTA